MAKLIIDGDEIEVPDHYTVLQACEEAGAEIPRFCFHERLSIAGNCRMCLVEVKGGPPKPQASCALGVRDCRPGPNGEPPVIETRSPMVKKAREGVMEFLLINHPLDCPICDQGGECDLQDQAMAYGVDKNRFAENKRAVEDKYIGPLVRTKMTRCIHCTRCVRFTTEVAGISELGLLGRGEDAEITTYLETAMTSEMQGNVIDLCPVGALTSRPYQDTARPWELRKTESIDVMDAVGSNIRVDARGREVMRIMPRLHEDVNEEWISDKSRFIWDGLRTQRLDQPYVRKSGKLKPATWDEAFKTIAAKIRTTKADRIGAIAGGMTGVEEMYAMKQLLAAIGSANMDCRAPGSILDPSRGRESYLFNATVAGIEESDALLIVGSNPRFEAPVLNSRILKRVKMDNYPVGVVGVAGDLRYGYEDLGYSADAVKDLVSGKNKFAAKLKSASKPLIIIGQGALNRSDSSTLLGMVCQLAMDTDAITEDWNGLSILHTEAGMVGGLDVGFVPGKGGLDTAAMMENMDILFLMGADELDMQDVKGFTVYVGTHGDAGAHRADVILPASAYTEKSATYVNTEGRVQMTSRAGFAPGDAKEDWAILRALSAVMGKALPFDSLAELRTHLYAEFPHFASLDEVTEGGVGDVRGLASALGATKNGKVLTAPLSSTVKDFFMTNPIARASRVMADCSALRSGALEQAAE
ncbi:MAG: NADH-quinone oxidoreductase subunit NuoG [Pseudomonadota bacterium]